MFVCLFLTARKSIGIFAKRLQATTCANESVRGLDRANKPLILVFPSWEVNVIPFWFGRIDNVGDGEV